MRVVFRKCNQAESMGGVQSKLAEGKVSGEWQWEDEFVYSFCRLCPDGNKAAGDRY